MTPDEQTLDKIRNLVLRTFGYRGEAGDSDMGTLELVTELALEVAGKERSYAALFDQMQMVRDLNRRQENQIRVAEAAVKALDEERLAIRQAAAKALGTSVLEDCSTADLVFRMIESWNIDRDSVAIARDKVTAAERHFTTVDNQRQQAQQDLSKVHDILGDAIMAAGSTTLNAGTLERAGQLASLAFSAHTNFRSAFKTKEQCIADLSKIHDDIGEAIGTRVNESVLQRVARLLKLTESLYHQPDPPDKEEPQLARTESYLVKLKPEAVQEAMKPVLDAIAKRIRSKIGRSSSYGPALACVASAIEEVVGS